MCDKPEHEFYSQSPGRRTKASLILFVISAAIVLLDIIGTFFLSGGYDVVSVSLHDQLQVLALLSVPFILVLLAIGSVLGILGWRAERKASGRSSRMTVVAACLNLASLLIGTLLILVALVFFPVGPYE
jgi:glucan phosphoethanolaminetransferase (alkaline phosphatase superfamily)